MAAAETTSKERVQQELERERQELAESVATLRASADPAAALRARLPLLVGIAFAATFVLAGGVGATMRLLARRGREGRERARVGRFTVVDRRR